MPQSTPAASPRQKFEELILYVARECESDSKCGSTKLNKILFYADFAAYRKLGASISGQEYQKLQFGPAPRQIVPTIEALGARGACAWAERNYHGYALKKLLALREPDLSHFSGEEIDIVRDVIEELRPFSAKEVSDLSHDFIGWRVAEPGETIPYDTVWLEEPIEMTKDLAAWAHDVANQRSDDLP